MRSSCSAHPSLVTKELLTTKVSIDSIQRATNQPAATMSNAIVDALPVVGGKRLAVASGYTEEINAQFRMFLQESGFDVVALRGLGLLTPGDNLSRHQLDSSSTFPHGPHAFWAGVRLLRFNAAVEGFGTVLSKG